MEAACFSVASIAGVSAAVSMPTRAPRTASTVAGGLGLIFDEVCSRSPPTADPTRTGPIRAGQPSDLPWRQPVQAGQVRPLVVERLKGPRVEEDRRSVLAQPPLQRRRDEVADSASG